MIIFAHDKQVAKIAKKFLQANISLYTTVIWKESLWTHNCATCNYNIHNIAVGEFCDDPLPYIEHAVLMILYRIFISRTPLLAVPTLVTTVSCLSGSLWLSLRPDHP